MRLQQQVAIITGARGGIGRATAQLFAQEGARLVLVSRDAPAIQQQAEALRAEGFEAIAISADVANPAQVAQVIQGAQEAFGRIDILVNGAGIGILKPFLELSIDEFDQMVATNMRGTFLMSQAAARVMATQKRGTIVQVIGVLGRAPMINAAGYAASKYGMNGLSKVMTLELRRMGIRTISLYLGGVDSPFWDTIEMKVQRDKMLTVGDAANAIVFAATQPDTIVMNELVLQPESHQLL